MEWKKTSPEMIRLLEQAVDPFPSEKKTMFGYPVFFVNQNMFAGLHQDDLFIRLAAADQQELRAAVPDARQLEPMPGRPMREYMVVPPAVYRDAGALDRWLDRSYRFVLSLPPKDKKRAKK